MQIRWTNKALDNLDAAIEYITANNPAAARKVARNILNSIRLLKDQPGLGRPGRVTGTRELVISGLPYIVPYLEEDGRIVILRIMHSSRKWPASFQVKE
jgi:toxin ParE1/3/4